MSTINIIERLIESEQFIDNPHLIEYSSLIESALLDERSKDVVHYYENHHIIPKSFGGNDDLNNMVLLEYEEHYLAHKLLIECTDNINKSRMSWALALMMNSKKGKQLVTPEEYASAKKEFSIYNPFKRPDVIKACSDRMKIMNESNNPMKNPVTAKKNADAKRNNPIPANQSLYHITYIDGETTIIKGLKNVLKHFGLKKSCSSSIVRAVQKNRFIVGGLLDGAKITRI